MKYMKIWSRSALEQIDLEDKQEMIDLKLLVVKECVPTVNSTIDSDEKKNLIMQEKIVEIFFSSEKTENIFYCRRLNKLFQITL